MFNKVNGCKNSMALMALSAFLPGCSANENPKNDFQTVCGYFQELERVSDVGLMTPEDRNKFISGRITKNIPTSPVKISWEAVSYAVPGERYEIFKMGAESVLNEAWDCPAMQKLAPLTGHI